MRLHDDGSEEGQASGEALDNKTVHFIPEVRAVIGPGVYGSVRSSILFLLNQGVGALNIQTQCHKEPDRSHRPYRKKLLFNWSGDVYGVT